MVSVISIYDTSLMGSPDPSGLAFDPVTGTLLLVDSEVDERPFNSATNMIEIGTDGVLDTSYGLTAVTPEPTGVTFNTVTGTVFVSDDDTGMVHEVLRDDPTVEVSSFSAKAFGAVDIEDIVAAPDGTLFIMDEGTRTIWHSTTDGQLLDSVSLPNNLKRPSALAYDPAEDVFYVSGGWSADIFKVSRSGSVLETIKVLRDHRNGNSHAEPKALVFVPSSDPTQGPTLWAADVGDDGVADGRLFQIQLDAPPPPPPPPSVSMSDGTPAPQTEGAGVQVAFTVTLSEAMAEDVVVIFDTVDGTAVAGADFVGVTGGTATIAAGTLSATILVDVIDDALAESEESFAVAIRSAATVGGASVDVADGEGTAVLVDDDSTGPSPVAVYDATAYGSPDPAGLVYVPSLGAVILVDSEVNESPFFSDTNMFTLGTDGTLLSTTAYTATSNEPTGVAYWRDPATGQELLFTTNDDQHAVIISDMANPTVEIGRLDVHAFGAVDAEDIAVDPASGNLFVVDESNAAIFEVTQAGVPVSTIQLAAAVGRPEAIAYDAVHDYFYVSGYQSADIFRVGRDGSVLETITELRDYPRPDGGHVVPKGLALVPDADGSDGATLWVADYGVDQTADGRILTLHVDPPPPPAVAMGDGSPAPQTEGAGAQVTFTITMTEAVPDDVTVTVSTVDGTATAGTDFIGLSGASATIAAGSTSTTVAVALLDDAEVEAQEAFSLSIDSATRSDGSAVEIADAAGDATIIDDDGTAAPRVMVYDATVYGSPDPAGLTYVSTRGTVLMSDSEVTEKPFYSNINLFELNTDASLAQGIDLTAVTVEATGVGHWFDAATGRDLLFISDDDTQSIYMVDMADPTVELARISTPGFGCNDPEDVTVDPMTGNLYVVGESSSTIFEITQSGALVSTTVLPSVAARPEAVAHDAADDAFWVSGYRSNDIFKVARDGTLLDTLKDLRDYDSDAGNNVVPKGLALVPDADGTGRDLWVADYGVDQVADGRLFVIDLDQDPTAFA